ncbi:MAG: thioredoxin-dependent thiol peroxidase [Rickettsiales bacterium]|nr:thioredoxin-dependent thiol peroxidase [Rickettsiales bacterium]
MSVNEGDHIPDFSLPADGGDTVSLADYKGKNIVLYFYPKDDTPGCTKESEAFRDMHEQFTDANTVILGVSKDSVASHDKFKAKYDLPFKLISDEEHSMLEAFGVWKEKNMYGKKYMGIERTTFLIDGEGIVKKRWSKVKVKGHVEEVLAQVS